MVTKTAAVLVLILVATIAAIGCSQGNSGALATPSPTSGGNTGGTVGVVRPTWIDAQISGNTVSVPKIEVDSGKMLHFKVAGQGAQMAFMAYKLGEETYVRANLCVPCQSQSFSLAGDVLDCNTCHTKFEARTGKGITGPCRNYPKAEVAYAISDGKITMGMDDLLTAYENTQKPGWP